MAIEVEGPDGNVYEFPDGTPVEVMRAAMQKRFAEGNDPGKIPARLTDTPFGPDITEAYQGAIPDVRKEIASLPEDQRADALKGWARATVAREVRDNPGMMGAADSARAMARGTLVGSWLDEMNAATNAAAYKLSGGKSGAPYDETLAYNRARDDYQDNVRSAKLFSVPIPGVGGIDVTTGGLLKLGGGIGSAAAAPFGAVPIMRGQTLLPRMVNSGVTGAGVGAIYGAGEGETAGERGLNAAVGAGIGGVVGAAAPAVSRGISRLTAPRAQPEGSLTGLDRRGVGFIADDMVSDEITPQRAAMLRAMMGREGTLADMGPNLQSTTGAIGRTQGEGRRIVQEALGRTVSEGRRAGAEQRITSEINKAMGQPQPINQVQRQVVQAANATARPYYRELERTIIPDSPAIQRLLQRVDPAAIRQAETMMRRQGYQPNPLFRTGRDWDYIRRAVDDLARNAERGTFERNTLEDLSRTINNTIDNYLRRRGPVGPNTPPGQSSWELARAYARPGQVFRENLQLGRKAFDPGVTPEQVAEQFARAPGNMGPEGYRMGAREALRATAGRAASAMGPTGDTALMRKLQATDAREKMATLAGRQAADRITNRIGTEATFEQTRQAAVGNSVTAAMTEAQRRLGLNQATPQTADSLIGMVRKVAGWATRKLAGGYQDERLRRMTADMARVLVADGANRDAYIRDLQRYIANRNVQGMNRRLAEELLDAMVTGSRGPAIEAATAR